MRRSSRLSQPPPAETEKPSRAGDNTPGPQNKRPKRTAEKHTPGEAAEVTVAPAAAATAPAPKGGMASEGGPSAYELERLEKMKRNAMVMASLGLGGANGGMRAAVKSEAAQRAKSRGLSPRQPKRYPPRSRESARVKGNTPEGVPMEDPEEAFNRGKLGLGVPVDRVPESTRFVGDVSMSASNASADGIVRLRQMMGGLVGRHGGDRDEQEYELAEPDEVLKKLRGLKVEETGVSKVVRERAYSLAWHPSRAKLLLAVGDKVGNVGLWTVEDEAADDDDDGTDSVFQFKPHIGSVARLTFDSVDGNKLLSTSYDGTVRRMDVEKGAFEQVFANDVGADSFFTDGHLMAEEKTLLLSDGVGDVTAVDLRTNTKVWKREAHEKKANTVHTNPVKRHLFITASLDRTVRLWDARNLGAGTGSDGVGGMKPLAVLPHSLSVNSAHFSPGGEWVATVAQNDIIGLYEDLAQASGSQVFASHVLPHNNKTGRWLTKFQASWDPKSKGLFSIGSMQKGPHGIHLYSVTRGAKRPSAVEVTGGDLMTSIQSVVAFHPSRDVLAGANASGRAHVFM